MNSAAAGINPLGHCPFSYRKTKDGQVQIFHENRPAKTLKGNEAIRTLIKLENSDEHSAQLHMAKITGQFKFGNEALMRKTEEQ